MWEFIKDLFIKELFILNFPFVSSNFYHHFEKSDYYSLSEYPEFFISNIQSSFLAIYLIWTLASLNFRALYFKFSSWAIACCIEFQRLMFFHLYVKVSIINDFTVILKWDCPASLSSLHKFSLFPISIRLKLLKLSYELSWDLS